MLLCILSYSALINNYRQDVPYLKAISINHLIKNKKEKLQDQISNLNKEILKNYTRMRNFVSVSDSVGSISLEFKEHKEKQKLLKDEITSLTKQINELPKLVNIEEIKNIPLTREQKKSEEIYIFLDTYYLWMVSILSIFTLFIGILAIRDLFIKSN